MPVKDWHILFKVRHIIIIVIITVSSVTSPQPASTLLEQSADTCSAPRTAPLCEPSRWRLFTASGLEELGSELGKVGQLVQDTSQRKHRPETERANLAEGWSNLRRQHEQGARSRSGAGIHEEDVTGACWAKQQLDKNAPGRGVERSDRMQDAQVRNSATPVSLRHSGTSGHSGGHTDPISSWLATPSDLSLQHQLKATETRRETLGEIY